MNSVTAAARVCAAHNDLRTACRITNRTGTRCFALGVFLGRLTEIENELRSSFRASFIHEHEAYAWFETIHEHEAYAWFETIQRIAALRETFTRIYVEGWI